MYVDFSMQYVTLHGIVLFFESSYSKHLLFLPLLPPLQLVTSVYITISHKTLMYEYTIFACPRYYIYCALLY